MACIVKDGLLHSLYVNGHDYAFRTEPEHAGPVFHIVYAGQERIGHKMHDEGDGWYGVRFWGVKMMQRVEDTANGLRIHVRLKNDSSQTFRPDRVSLCLGIDTYMDRYPDWNDKVFPTMLRCEKTHLWGYFRAPAGKLLGIACPEPIPSWALEYNHFFCDNGHRIYTVRLDLLSMQRQPERHPVIDYILPGEEKCWTIDLFDAPNLTSVLATCSRLCSAPIFEAEKLIVEPNETAAVRILCDAEPAVPGYDVQREAPGVWRINLSAGEKPGVFRVTARANEHESELVWYRRAAWSFYLDAARQAALDMPQKAGSHCESWYGFFSAFQAARYLPKPELDAELLRQFEQCLVLNFDTDDGVPRTMAHRIQNTAIAVSLCEDAWQCTHDEEWLRKGARLADFLIDHCQNSEGVFCNRHVHYTCVIYIAKSILELWLAEQSLPSPEWRARADKHFAAARRAIDELVLHRDNIGTEGEHTFEDGMISCAVTQIAMMGLLVPEGERAPYIEAAEAMLDKHRCLERMGSADARSRNTTLRFWEAQYDVLIPANMINSPHGWSAWKIYGVWYLYLLTGKVEHLIDAMETLGSCAQLIGLDGKLRWAFVPDPCITAGQWKPDAEGKGYLARETFGETYVDMISGWYRAPENTPVFGYLGVYPQFETDQGGCCDNDVHECFKALAEVALPYAYLYEQNGTLHAFNGAFTEQDDRIIFTPAESIVRGIHVNLGTEREVQVCFATGDVCKTIRFGWVGKHQEGT